MRKKVLIVQPIHQSGIELLKKEVEVVLASNPSIETVCKEIKAKLIELLGLFPERCHLKPQIVKRKT